MDATWEIRNCDVLEGLKSLPANSVHCVVTSPPYWGLRDYGTEGQLGLERTPDEFVSKMVEVFAAVRGVMRDDATLWLNIGDSYNAYNGGAGPGGWKASRDAARPQLETGYGLRCRSLKPKDLVGIPWMLAFALRADGWYLRSEIIWHKKSPMPESVRDRPTKAHEQIFLLSKSARYFYDAVASAEPVADATIQRQSYGRKNQWGHVIEANGHSDSREFSEAKSYGAGDFDPSGGRNMRSVWTLSPEFFSGAHFATYPTELVRRCLLAGTSEKGCCATCGAPWRRKVKKDRVATRPARETKLNHAYGNRDDIDPAINWRNSTLSSVVGNRDPERTETVTVGWQPGCECGGEPAPCLVLDPFTGAGTTCVVSRRLGLRFVGFELNAEYAEMARKRVREDMPLLNCG